MDDLPAVVLKPSRLQAVIIALAAVCATLALAISALSLFLKLSLILLVCALGAREYQYAQRMAFTALGCTQGQWWVVTQNRKQEIELCGDQVVLPWLVVLRWAPQRTLAIWRDSVSREDHRRLRVALCFGRR